MNYDYVPQYQQLNHKWLVYFTVHKNCLIDTRTIDEGESRLDLLFKNVSLIGGANNEWILGDGLYLSDMQDFGRIENTVSRYIRMVSKFGLKCSTEYEPSMVEEYAAEVTTFIRFPSFCFVANNYNSLYSLAMLPIYARAVLDSESDVYEAISKVIDKIMGNNNYPSYHPWLNNHLDEVADKHFDRIMDACRKIFDCCEHDSIGLFFDQLIHTFNIDRSGSVRAFLDTLHDDVSFSDGSPPRVWGQLDSVPD